jgi:LPXTG-motif cell wall-anchored protein
MQKKIIILSIFFSIICFSLATYTVVAQSQNPCSSCPKGVTFECKVEWNTAKRGTCQSDQEWYYYELMESAPGASIIVTPEQGTDIDLYAVWDKSCPSTSKYVCVSNSAGPGKVEECHYVFTSFNSPNYFLVNRVSGSGCYNILLSKYKSAPIQTTQSTISPTTIQSTISPTTTPNTVTPQNKTGKNNLLTFVLIGVIIVIILLLVVKFKKKH